MNKRSSLIMAGMLLAGATAMAKPLKIFILAGQSNMEGHAHVNTFDHIGMDPATVPMLKDMRNADGSARVCDDVRIALFTSTGGWGKTPTPVEKKGALTIGYGAQKRGPKIGPEYTFGIYMHKHLDEPFLIIKTAWGGKSLNTDFRSPGAGPYAWHEKTAPRVDEEKREQKKKATGVYYRLMLEHVRKVLASPAGYHPAYNAKDGYEIAGFVWFQGFNDMVDSWTYPERTKPGGYDLYGELLAHFIRDVRKDLDAPKMPFVIGVIGVDGPTTPESEAKKQARYRGIAPGIRKAMAAPALMPEFKGNVVAVYTDKYWDSELHELADRMWQVVDRQEKEAVKKQPDLTREQRKELRQKIVDEAYTPEELKILEVGRSNKAYHYLGSAKIIGGIGKAFADAMAEMLGMQ